MVYQTRKKEPYPNSPVIFPGRVKEAKRDLRQRIETRLSHSGVGSAFGDYEYELLCVRLPKKEKQNNRVIEDFIQGQQKKVSAYYIAVSGPGVPSISLKEELEKLANFASLAPR